MFRVEFNKRSAKFLRECEKEIYRRVLKKIEILAENPFLQESIKIMGSDNIYRVRVGKYRVLYSVEKDILIVHNIDKRGKVYK